MQDRIKQMAVEAGLHINGQTSDQRMSACERFAQAVARECEQAVFASSNPSTHEGAIINRLARQAIRARFGLGGVRCKSE